MSVFKKGDNIKIKNTVSSTGKYGSHKGKEGIITAAYKFYGGSQYYTVKFGDCDHLTNVSHQVLESVEKTSKSRFIKRIQELEKEMTIIKEKLKFLKETGQEMFNENEFKVYKTLSLIDKDNLSQYEKAKKIAELLK